MGINKYKIYPSSSYDDLDLTKIEPGIRWNLSGTEFIVEFINEPDNYDGVLTQPEARQIMITPEWTEKIDE